MSVYRDERLIRKLEQDMEENECGASDCLWLFCCGVFGLVCVVPKYNKRKFTSELLLNELKKPEQPKYNQFQSPSPLPVVIDNKGGH